MLEATACSRVLQTRGENKRQFFIPRGFAHGFLVLSDGTSAYNNKEQL